MKLTADQKKIKFENDLKNLSEYGVIVNSYDNTYQIVIGSYGYVFDYYSSTEFYSSRCSSNKMIGRSIGYLMATLERIRDAELLKRNEDSKRIPLISEVELNTLLTKIVDENNGEPFIVQSQAKPKGFFEEIAFNFLKRRGYSVFRADK